MDQGPSLAEAAVLLWVPVCLCALALLVVLAAQRRRQLKHGVVLYSDRPSQALRRWALTVPLVALAQSQRRNLGPERCGARVRRSRVVRARRVAPDR